MPSAGANDNPDDPRKDSLVVHLINGATGRSISGDQTIPDRLRRAELPPQLTLRAESGDKVTAVRFKIGQQEEIDQSPPYQASADFFSRHFVNSSPARLSILVESLNAEGGVVAALTKDVAISCQGMDSSFARLSDEDNAQVVSENFENLMRKETFPTAAGFNLPYRLHVPTRYDQSVKYPLVIWLHGRGQRGTDNTSMISPDHRLFHGAFSLVSPNMQHDYPSFIIVPQCSNTPDTEEWARWEGDLNINGQRGTYKPASAASPSGAAVLALIEDLKKRYAIDPDRIYITGESMGGFGTWDLTMRRPDLFGAAVPMAGFTDPTGVDKVKPIPFWIIHSASDEFNPYEGSLASFEAMQKMGADVRATIYARELGINHGASFTKAWNEEAILPWMFSQSRNGQRL